MSFKNMEIVAANKIPKAIDTPLNDLIKIYNTCLEMQVVCIRENGVGLSAVQVGIPWKLFIIRKDNTNLFDFFVNCEYFPIADSSKFLSTEGCLSLRNKNGKLRRFVIERYDKINLRGKKLIAGQKNPELVEINATYDGVSGIICQHETDHHFGILISDKGKEINLF
jgi:peptide deformylase